MPEKIAKEKTMQYCNMSDLLRGQTSKFITLVYEDSPTGIILENGDRFWKSAGLHLKFKE